MKLPDRIDGKWVDSLKDNDLLKAEFALHKTFVKLESEEKKLRGERYELMRSSAPLMDAWLRWSTVCTATRARGLHPRYRR